MKARVVALDHHVAPEHEFEAAPGLPEPLPPGERILWQGAPLARAIARDAMHTRLLAGYFATLLAWRAATVLGDGGRLLDAALAVAWLLPLAAAALGALTLMGYLVARTSLYTITDRRVVMRIGVVLNITFNLPFAKIASVGLHVAADGSGDLPLTLAGTDNIAYVHLWPHVRPWRVARTQPMLRGLPDARRVAAVLAEALAADTDARSLRRPPRVELRSPNEPATAQPLAA